MTMKRMEIPSVTNPSIVNSMLLREHKRYLDLASFPPLTFSVTQLKKKDNPYIVGYTCSLEGTGREGTVSRAHSDRTNAKTSGR